jgi:hypothetical protein
MSARKRQLENVSSRTAAEKRQLGSMGVQCQREAKCRSDSERGNVSQSDRRSLSVSLRERKMLVRLRKGNISQIQEGRYQSGSGKGNVSQTQERAMSVRLRKGECQSREEECRSNSGKERVSQAQVKDMSARLRKGKMSQE